MFCTKWRPLRSLSPFLSMRCSNQIYKPRMRGSACEILFLGQENWAEFCVTCAFFSALCHLVISPLPCSGFFRRWNVFEQWNNSTYVWHFSLCYLIIFIGSCAYPTHPPRHEIHWSNCKLELSPKKGVSSLG